MSDRSNRIYDEFARLFTDAANVAQGVKREAETLVRSQAERFVGDMDLVRREDFDAVREMASRARAENERLAARLAVLEEKLGVVPPAEPPRPARRKPAGAAPGAARARRSGPVEEGVGEDVPDGSAQPPGSAGN